MFSKRILLFDIDGTLTKSSKTVGSDVLLQTVSQTYGKKMEKKDVIYSGGTDRLIWKWLLEANGVEWNDTPEEIEKMMSVYRVIIREGIKNGSWTWNILPNVNELLQKCSEQEDFILALLTGNMVETAEIKLRTAGVKVELLKRPGQSELFGGFGSDHMDRPTIVKMAIEKCNQIFGCQIPKENFLIIGDTPKDVHCAHANGIPALAVCTGIFNSSQLSEIADACLEDFSDIDAAIKAFRDTKLKKELDSTGKSYDIKPVGGFDP